MADVTVSLGTPLLDQHPEAPPRRSRAGVRVVEASELDAPGGSSSDEPGPGRRPWGRYASLASRRSRGSTRSRPNVEIFAKTREWGQINDSSSDDELPGAQDRQERYARIAQEMEAEAKGIKIEDSEKDGQGSRWLCFSCCAFCLLQDAISASSVVLTAELRNLAVVCCLAPSAIFLTFLDVCLASTDRSIVHLRYRLRRSASLLRLLALETFVFVVLGCLHGYWLLQAYRHWMCIDLQGSFLAELENLNPVRKSFLSRRWDSHYLLWSVPTVVCLTCSLTLGSFGFPEAIFWYAVLALAIFSAAVSVESFDCATSHQVRKWYGIAFNQRHWTENCYDGGEAKKLRRFHRAARVSEVFGRVLVLVAVSKVIPYWPTCAIAVLMLDYGVCILVLCSNSGLTLEVPVVSVALFLVNIARHVDEPGFALPAQRVSRALDAVRLLEFAFAAVACMAVALGAFGAPAMRQGALLLILLALVQAQGLVLRRFLGIEGRHGDLFTAVSQADLKAMEESLDSEGSCTIDMVLCDGTQQTALHLAAAGGHLECVQFLLEHGAKRNAIDWKMENPLHIAVRKQHWIIARALLQGDDFVGETNRGKDLKQVFQMVQQMNLRAETPEDLLRENAAPEFAELLADIASQAAEADVQGRLRIRSSGSSNSPPGSLLHTVSSSLMNNLFGSIVGGEHANVQAGPREKVQRAELAAFMFFRGMGEHLQRLHLYFRGFRKMRRCSHRVHVSNLLTVATLGAGGFGKVLKVEDVRSGNVYALKLQCRNKTTKQAVREVQALTATAQHPYIVELVQIFRTSSFYGILMEFCSKDLNRRILEQESAVGRAEGLPPGLAARYAACVMFALEYLHGRCFVFRDLKPENVLVVEKDDHAKLADFGLARTVAKETNEDGELMCPKVSMAAGTPGFMSSEAFQGAPEGDEDRGPGWFAARDWYGLGCCLLLMLLGEGGGRKVYAAKRLVLLPAPGGEILELLLRALDAEAISEEAFDLVSSLTAAQVTERADSKACRANAFLEAAIRELEPVGLDAPEPEA